MKAFMTYYWDVLRNHYVDFKGRATRKTFWLFFLFTSIIFLILSVILSFFGDAGTILYFVCRFAVVLPFWSIVVRRLHDANYSAWWILLALLSYLGWLVLLIFLVMPSTEGENRFGK